MPRPALAGRWSTRTRASARGERVARGRRSRRATRRPTTSTLRVRQRREHARSRTRRRLSRSLYVGVMIRTRAASRSAPDARASAPSSPATGTGLIESTAGTNTLMPRRIVVAVLEPGDHAVQDVRPHELLLLRGRNLPNRYTYTCCRSGGRAARAVAMCMPRTRVTWTSPSGLALPRIREQGLVLPLVRQDRSGRP